MDGPYKNTKVLTSRCCAGSGEEGVMEDVKKMYIKWMDTCINARVLTSCCCEGSGEGVMEDVKKCT